jgi:microcystin-dependent protein
MWSGAVDAVPEGWLLCDGENGTPDLRDRFIVGAGTTYEMGETGGADNVTPAGSVQTRRRAVRSGIRRL